MVMGTTVFEIAVGPAYIPPLAKGGHNERLGKGGVKIVEDMRNYRSVARKN